jgi:hypothetical protein
LADVPRDAGSTPGSGGAGGADASNETIDASEDEASSVEASTDDVAISDVGGATYDAFACDAGTTPTPMGATIEVRPPATLASALANARAGDRVLLFGGTYAREDVSGRTYAAPVFVEAAPGEKAVIQGARFVRTDHLSFRGVSFAGTVLLDGSHDFAFREVTFDGGTSEEAALQIHGQSAAGASHDVLVERSKIAGGGRTVFVLGAFAPSDKWNHHLTFVHDDFSCGSHNCFQLSGARDMLIEDSRIDGTSTAGVLLAGATRVTISRNRFHAAGQAPAIQIATPGMEWDNYAGVENMISSAVVVANNVIDGWATGVQLDAARDVAIVYNTVADGTGIRFNHRTPHDQSNNVILDGNHDIRVWNDILPSISVASGETRPAFESNNLVWKAGGAGPGLVTSAPIFASTTDYALAPTSPGIDAAVVTTETPPVDFDGRPRGAKPDIGAHELGAPMAACR